MTLEEAIKKASTGDVNSIIAVADYYMEKETIGGCMEALKWYEQAASRGVKYASLQAAKACINIAISAEEQDMDDAAYDMWNQGVMHATNGIPEAGEDTSNYDVALEMMEMCLYGAAVQDYINSRLDLAMEKLRVIGLRGSSVRANLLYSVCIIESVSGRALSDAEKAEMRELIETAFLGISNYATAQGVGAARHMEQLIFARSAKLLSYFYDRQSATDLLKNAYLAVTDDSAKSELTSALLD